MVYEYFLSYHHRDKRLAGEIKNHLRDDAFLAHEDVEVTTEWRRIILRELENCAALIAIVTKNFPLSPWANQEVGFAIAKGKLVGSLIFQHSELPGFLQSLQGVHATQRNIDGAVEDLTSRLYRLQRNLPAATQAYGEMRKLLIDFVFRWDNLQFQLSRTGPLRREEIVEGA